MSDGGDGVDDDRRTLLRVVIALAVGIPILVEVLTFAGLLEAQFGGGGGDDGDGATPTTQSGVGVGDVLPIEGDAVARLTAATLQQSESERTLALTVTVENRGAVPTELRLETVTATGGQSASGGASSGEIAPGETGSVSETWTLPRTARPTSLVVVTTTYGTETRRRAVTVELGKIPVRG
jgi:hypothetical protein